MTRRRNRVIAARPDDQQITIGRNPLEGFASAVLVPVPRLAQIRLILLYGRYIVYSGRFSRPADALDYAKSFDYSPPLVSSVSKGEYDEYESAPPDSSADVGNASAGGPGESDAVFHAVC